MHKLVNSDYIQQTLLTSCSFAISIVIEEWELTNSHILSFSLLCFNF